MRIRNTGKESSLPIQELNRIRLLFEQKNWPIMGDVDEQYYENFCLTVQAMTPEQAEVFLSLSEDFLWVKDHEYIQRFVRAFDKYISAKPVGTQIVIGALLPEADFKENKSSRVLLYFIKSIIVALQKKYAGKSISILEDPEKFPDENYSDTAELCLVDDFIGSGETAISAVNYYLGKGVALNRIAVLSLVAMKQGVSALSEKQIAAYADVSLDRAISDRTDGRGEHYRNVMLSIEERIRVRKEYSLGYAQSEALVKMMRTPNNTFPIYWLNNKQNKHAPFPR